MLPLDFNDQEYPLPPLPFYPTPAPAYFPRLSPRASISSTVSSASSSFWPTFDVKQEPVETPPPPFHQFGLPRWPESPNYGGPFNQSDNYYQLPTTAPLPCTPITQPLQYFTPSNSFNYALPTPTQGPVISPPTYQAEAPNYDSGEEELSPPPSPSSAPLSPPFLIKSQASSSSTPPAQRPRASRASRVSRITAPVPVPNLTKKSRGRRVPTKPTSNGDKKGRGYTCEVVGCGKCFQRGEHLKRHIRSIHTNDKPHACPYPGCSKAFSRYDNLCQHMRVHKNYSAPKDGGHYA